MHTKRKFSSYKAVCIHVIDNDPARKFTPPLIWTTRLDRRPIDPSYRKDTGLSQKYRCY